MHDGELRELGELERTTPPKVIPSIALAVRVGLCMVQRVRFCASLQRLFEGYRTKLSNPQAPCLHQLYLYRGGAVETTDTRTHTRADTRTYTRADTRTKPKAHTR